jgi:hypothetical protein
MSGLPEAGFVYMPTYWPHTGPWERRPGTCCASVGSGFSSSQCGNRSKVEREVCHHGKTVTLPYCGTHDPVAVAAKKAARDAKWRANWVADQKRADDLRAERLLKDAALEAIRKIAAGHNDPRALALEVLAPTPTKEAE